MGGLRVIAAKGKAKIAVLVLGSLIQSHIVGIEHNFAVAPLTLLHIDQRLVTDSLPQSHGIVYQLVEFGGALYGRQGKRD